MEEIVYVCLPASNIAHITVRSAGIAVTQQDKLLNPDCTDRHTHRNEHSETDSTNGFTKRSSASALETVETG